MNLTLRGPLLARDDINISIHFWAEGRVASWPTGLQPFGDVLFVIHVCCDSAEKLRDSCVIGVTYIRARHLSCLINKLDQG